MAVSLFSSQTSSASYVIGQSSIQGCLWSVLNGPEVLPLSPLIAGLLSPPSSPCHLTSVPGILTSPPFPILKSAHTPVHSRALCLDNGMALISRFLPHVTFPVSCSWFLRLKQDSKLLPYTKTPCTLLQCLLPIDILCVLLVYYLSGMWKLWLAPPTVFQRPKIVLSIQSALNKCLLKQITYPSSFGYRFVTYTETNFTIHVSDPKEALTRQLTN